jgi:hypothetical protein
VQCRDERVNYSICADGSGYLIDSALDSIVPTEFSMKDVLLNLPALGFIVATRAVLGVGIGLLMSERLPAGRRRTIGATLIAVGAATTVPAAMSVIRGMRRSQERGRSSSIDRDERLIGASRFPRNGDDIA